MKSVTRTVVDDARLSDWTVPWHGLVQERQEADGSFVADEGPFRTYRRTVTVHRVDGGHEVTSTVTFRLAVPYFGWLVAVPVRFALRRPGAPLPWWGPADRLTARAATVLGALCAASAVAGYLGTSITQAITYAADDFGIEGDRPQGYALAVVRLAVFVALGLVAVADRRGRRRILLLAAATACVLSASTALAPSLAWFTVAQTLTRGCSTALGVLIAVVAAEEMPAGARAFGASVLGMSAALGAGMCVLALPVTEVDDGGWRLLFVLPLLVLPLLPGLARHLPESRRFLAQHADATVAGHGDRLRLLAASTFLFQLFAAPASQLQNEFLRDDRGYTAIGISAFTVLTVTPAGLGVLAGGRLADTHGRRRVGAVGVVVGVGATVAMFASSGWQMWAWSLLGSVFAGLTVPALGVYGPELFPTGVRARANGILVFTAVIGSSLGLVAAGILSDRIGGLGPALAVLSIGPAVLAVLVLTRYPETAGLELEELNPEDAISAPGAPSPPPSTPGDRRPA